MFPGSLLLQDQRTTWNKARCVMAIGHSVSASDLRLSLFYSLCCTFAVSVTLTFVTAVGVSGLQLLAERLPKRLGERGKHLDLSALMESATEY